MEENAFLRPADAQEKFNNALELLVKAELLFREQPDEFRDHLITTYAVYAQIFDLLKEPARAKSYRNEVVKLDPHYYDVDGEVGSQ